MRRFTTGVPGWLNHLVWFEWERRHRRSRWPTSRLAPARLMYRSQWDRMVGEICDQFGEAEQYKAGQIIKIIMKYSKER
jgi:hypothetical protein